MAKKYLDKARSLVAKLLKPVLEEFNFFLAVLLINNSLTFGYIVGCFMYPDNSPYHAVQCLALGIAIAYVLTVVLHALKPRWARITFKAVCYTLLITLEAVYIFLFFNFEMMLGPRVLVLLAETNSKEASEFVSTYFLSAKSLWAYAAIATIIALVVTGELIKKIIKKAVNRRIPKAIITCIVLPLMLWGVYLSHNYVRLAMCKHSKELNQWVRDFGVDAIDHLSTSYYSLCCLKVSEADLKYAVNVAKAVEKSPITLADSDSLNVIVVMGESYIKQHASLYGYELNTTPNLIKERDKGNLIVFTDMVTPYNATSQVEKNFFSLNDYSGGEMWYDKPIFPAVFKHAGFNVYFWDNQRNYAKTEMFTITVNAFIYNDTIAALSYDETSNISMTFDYNLITNFQNKSKVPAAKNNLYIFHLMGQHVHPVGRYPKKKGFDVFNADSIKSKEKFLDKDKRTYIAQYDNATYYNDAVVQHILDLWKDKNTVVLYFSDHGDEAYDYRDHCGRGNVTTDNPQLLHCQFDVPFMVWCSDTYIKKHPQLYKELKQATARPGLVVDAAHMMLRLAGINSPYYQASLDISNPNYKAKKRIVSDKYNYDEVMARKP